MPSGLYQVLEHWMMQPGLQAWLYNSLPRRCLVPFKDGLTGGLGRPLKPATGEVARRQTASLVHDIDQDGRAIGVQGTFGLSNIVGTQGISQFLGTLLKQGLVNNTDTWSTFTVHHDKLEPLARHHSTQATTSCISAGPIGEIVKYDPGISISVFPSHTVARDGNVLAEPSEQFWVDLVKVFPRVLVGG